MGGLVRSILRNFRDDYRIALLRFVLSLFFELFSQELTLADNRPKRPNSQLSMVRNGNRNCGIVPYFLHDHMASPLADSRETILLEDSDYFSA